jgi:hypothetical protein
MPRSCRPRSAGQPVSAVVTAVLRAFCRPLDLYIVRESRPLPQRAPRPGGRPETYLQLAEVVAVLVVRQQGHARGVQEALAGHGGGSDAVSSRQGFLAGLHGANAPGAPSDREAWPPHLCIAAGVRPARARLAPGVEVRDRVLGWAQR